MGQRDGAIRGPVRSDPLRPSPRAPADAVPARDGGAGPGNQALQRMLRRRQVQAKLAVHPADDEYEREADRVADRLVSSTPGAAPDVAAASPSISRVQRQEAADRAAETPVPEEEEKKKRVEMMKVVEEEEKAAENEAGEPAEEEVVADEEREAEAAEKKEEEEAGAPSTVQTKRSAAALPTPSAGLERRLSLPAGGRPLPDDLRGYFEPRFGRDLSGVRLHTDEAAHRAAGELDALAFTHGRHVYLAPGAYRPDSDTGKRLLAHELVHVQQQAPTPALDRGTRHGGGPAAPAPSADAGPAPPARVTPVQRTAIQREEGKDEAPKDESEGEGKTDPSALPLETGRLDETAETVTFSELPIPGFKMAGHRGGLYASHSPLKRKKAYARGSTGQREVWKKALGGSTKTVEEKLKGKLQQDRAEESPGSAGEYVFTAPSKFNAKNPRYFIGDLATIARELTLPSWDKSGKPHSYDVDHIVELQVANWDTEGWANTIDNMEMLDSKTNQASGPAVERAVSKKADAFVKVTDGEYGKSAAAIKSKYTLAFEKASGAGKDLKPGVDYWTQGQIEAGDHVDPVKVADMGDLGGEGSVVVFPDPAGGVKKTIAWPGGVGKEKKWLAPFQITAKSFDTENVDQPLGSLTFAMPEENPTWAPTDAGPKTLPVPRLGTARYAGYLDKKAVRSALSGLRHRRMSPIVIDEVGVADQGLSVTGQIIPKVPLIENAAVDFALTGDELVFSKTFAGPELQVPKPFVVRESSLTVSAGTRGGLGLDGRADFGIDKVGEGHIAGKARGGDFALSGAFAFDSALFDPAELKKVEYAGGKLSVEGVLGITEGKVKGIKKATVSVSYSEETGTITASGDAELSVPGVEKSQLTVVYSEAEGLSIGGSFNLTSDVPGIKGGKVEAKLQRAGAGEWSMSASGSAEPDIPGVDAKLAISYDDGAFDMSVKTGYERGMASGTIEVGVTNRGVDETGMPGGAPAETLTLYGGGSVTLKIAPWLQATARLRLLPDGSMEVAGEVGLPSSLEVFPEKKHDKNLFRVGIDIPIVGVAVAGQRIGIFATISGGADLSAGIGPGRLSELKLGVTYNPEHEEDTKITGGAELQVPAHAGLRLSIRGGLGAGIPIVSATAALEIGGALGLDGMARAAVQVDWTPAAGLVLDAEGEVYVEPKLVFDVTGMVLVEADLLFTSIELYSKRWNLAGFELGSGLRFGVRFPVHYQEGQPFDVNWDQVEFEVPDIDAEQVLSGLMAQVI